MSTHLMEPKITLVEDNKRPAEESLGGSQKEMRVDEASDAPRSSDRKNPECVTGGMAVLLSVAKSDRDDQNGNGVQNHGVIQVPTGIAAPSDGTDAIPTAAVVVVGGSNPSGVPPPFGMPIPMPVMMSSVPGAAPFGGSQILTVVPSALPANSTDPLLNGQQEAIQTYRPTVLPATSRYVQISPASGNPPTVYADAEKVQQSMDVRTRVKCAGSATARDGGFSQKLWKKYGEKIVQPGRNKQGSAIDKNDPRSGCVKRSYFRCYNKICPARMTVDVLLETGEQLLPVGSGGHTHPFEIFNNKPAQLALMPEEENIVVPKMDTAALPLNPDAPQQEIPLPRIELSMSNP